MFFLSNSSFYLPMSFFSRSSKRLISQQVKNILSSTTYNKFSEWLQQLNLRPRDDYSFSGSPCLKVNIFSKRQGKGGIPINVTYPLIEVATMTSLLILVMEVNYSPLCQQFPIFFPVQISKKDILLAFVEIMMILLSGQNFMQVTSTSFRMQIVLITSKDSSVYLLILTSLSSP